MMSANSLNHPALARKQADRRESGIALVTALVLLLLLSGLIVAMIYSLRGDLLVNGYYRNFRGSFYAADSGLNVVREDFNNQLTAILNANVAAAGGTLPQGTPPLSPANGGAAGVLQTITNTYTPSYTLAGNGAQGTSSSTAASSWPESFKLDPNQAPTFAFISCSAFINNGNTPVGGANCSNLAGTNPDTYVYQYSYTLAVVGTSQGNQQTRLTDEGALTYTVKTKPSGGAPTVTSFAAWGMFIDQQTACQNGDLVPGTISGPVFTNGAWTFGNFSTKYVFTDNVGQAGANTGYDFGSNGCDQQNANSDTKSGVTIAPTFNQGFNRSQPSVPLPQNHFNQEQAVLDGIGMANSAPPTSALNTVLKNAAGTSYPSGGASSGVYLPFKTKNSSGQTLSPPVFTGGGIYVEGSATVQLGLGSTSTAQVYNITSNGVTSTVTIDPTPTTIAGVNYPHGTTSISTPGLGSTTVDGIPALRDNSGNPVLDANGNQQPANSLFVNGSITSLLGAGEGQPSIQDKAAITITSAGTVTINGDLIYKTPPVNSSDQLIPGNDNHQVLGIFTASGDIQMNDTQKNSSGQFDGNLQICASIATLSQGGSGGLTNTGPALNDLKIVGGRIQNQIKSINTTQRDVLFDRRFASGFAPPFFPSTTVTPGTSPVDTPTPQPPVFARKKWTNKSTTY